MIKGLFEYHQTDQYTQNEASRDRKGNTDYLKKKKAKTSQIRGKEMDIWIKQT